MAATPAEVTLPLRTFRQSPLSSARGQLGALWGRPITRAIAKALLTIYVTSTITFVLIRLMPGNPVELKIDELMQQSQMSYADAAALTSGLFDIDLGAPIHEQYVEYLGNLGRGNLGNSFLSRGTTVMSIILAVLPWTLFAVGTGLLLSFVVGIALGLVAAYRRDGALDHAVTTGGSVISSVPNYLVALLIVLIFGIQLRWIPITQMRGAFSPGSVPGFSPEFVGDVLFHASLPITGFFLTRVGLWILSMRSATLAVLEEDHVTVARARGLPDGRITTAYVGRNAVLPLVSQFAIAAGAVVGGAVVIEQIFVYSGVGLRLVSAVNARDYPVMQGIILMTTAAVIIANLVADLLYSRLDPRIGRAGGASGTRARSPLRLAPRSGFRRRARTRSSPRG